MDVTNRHTFEADMAKALARAFRRQMTIVMDALGPEPSLNKLTPSLYAEMQTALQAAIRPVLERAFLAQAKTLTEEPPRTKQAGGIGVEWGIVNQRATEWASQYSFDLVRGIVNTTRTTLQKQIQDYFTDGRTLKELRESLEGTFGPVRAAMIAQTEVTRSASEAEAVYADELRKLGLTVTFQWQTAADERVCVICDPRDGKLQGDGWQELPPAHPRCRCWVNAIVLSEPSTPIRASLKADDVNNEGYAVLYLDRVEGVRATQTRASEVAKKDGIEFDPVPRDELHITLVYANSIDDMALEAIGNVIKDAGFRRFELGSDMLEWFGEDAERRALVHRVFDEKLDEFQREVHGLFKELDVDDAMQLSEFSEPDDWNAHVTIGYSREFEMPSEDVEFDAGRFAVARGDYMNIVEVSANG